MDTTLWQTFGHYQVGHHATNRPWSQLLALRKTRKRLFKFEFSSVGKPSLFAAPKDMHNAQDGLVAPSQHSSHASNAHICTIGRSPPCTAAEEKGLPWEQRICGKKST
jgi:hypothetical protein